MTEPQEPGYLCFIAAMIKYNLCANIVSMAGAGSNACRSKAGETIGYDVTGSGRDRKLMVSYHRPAMSYATNPDLLTSFKEAKFEKRGRDIDVIFSLKRTLGPESMMSLSERAEIPFPLELYFVPKGYALKNIRLNVYTQLDDDEPKLKCKKELEYGYPAKLSWRDRAMDYFGLNQIFQK